MDLRHNCVGIIEGCKIVDGVWATNPVAHYDARGNTSLESFTFFKNVGAKSQFYHNYTLLPLEI